MIEHPSATRSLAAGNRVHLIILPVRIGFDEKSLSEIGVDTPWQTKSTAMRPRSKIAADMAWKIDRVRRIETYRVRVDTEG